MPGDGTLMLISLLAFSFGYRARLALSLAVNRQLEFRVDAG